MDFDRLKTYLNNTDKFSLHNGIKVTAISHGECEALFIAGNNTSADGRISPAAIIALAEKASVSAAYTCGYVCRCINATVNFTDTFANNGTFTARAYKVHHGRKTAVYNCDVFSDKELVFKGTFTLLVTEEAV